MVLLISDTIQETEIEVYDWLSNMGIKCKLISTTQFFNSLTLTFDDNYNFLIIDDNDLKNKYNKIWLRRDRFSSSRFLLNTNFDDIISYLEEEADTLKDFILEKENSNIKILSSYSNKKLNKLNVLKNAKEVGLNIPDFIITNRKSQLKIFLEKHQKIITKAVYENLRFDENNKRYFQYVEIITKNMLSEIPNMFFPSFFQKYISQKYEIRAFYLNGEVYAMANLLRKGLRGDIRRTGYVSRKIPYTFDKNNIDKITSLMNKYNLTIGALDFIIDDKDNLYFLEVNPNGNFLIVSKYCNYNLEEKVANYLAYG